MSTWLWPSSSAHSSISVESNSDACGWGSLSNACRFSSVVRMAAVLEVTSRCIKIIKNPMCRCLAARAWL